ncbi:leuS [Acrasis kona]|uniref:LeuS n=1 Tax=Acrasis kona TaxID=1008807 RepID=A0AAW2YR69_9EUKA
MRHLYTCLVHLIVRSRAYKNDPEFDAIVKNILAQYDNTEIYKVKDYVLKTNLENIIFDYHEQMNTTSRISKKKSILPDVSLYNIGHYVNIVFCIPAYVLTRYYCRMFRKGLNGPVRLMNHSLPAAYSALKLCLAISGWEFTSEMIKQHLFFDKAEPIDRKFVPLVLMLRYAPEVLLLAYSNLSNPFLILPYLIVIKGFISLTQFHLGSHLIGYEDKKSLTII